MFSLLENMRSCTSLLTSRNTRYFSSSIRLKNISPKYYIGFDVKSKNTSFTILNDEGFPIKYGGIDTSYTSSISQFGGQIKKNLVEIRNEFDANSKFFIGIDEFLNKFNLQKLSMKVIQKQAWTHSILSYLCCEIFGVEDLIFISSNHARAF